MALQKPIPTEFGIPAMYNVLKTFTQYAGATDV
jgi:hypothetical protein